jgi:hypothetical protein
MVHTLSFLNSPPPTSDQFKSQLHALFPTYRLPFSAPHSLLPAANKDVTLSRVVDIRARVVDTKFVASNSPELAGQCASTALGDIYAVFDGPQFQGLPAISFPGT